MPHYKLTYFPGKGLAEAIRFLFSYGGVEFEDYRFNTEDWPKLKPEMPFGVVPVLEVDGKEVCQSVAICRYLAKQFGVAGKNDWEALEIDSTVDTIHDLRLKIGAFFYETNEQVKAEKKKAAQELVPFYLERLDAQVKKNGGYFVGGALTWADFAFVALLDYLNYMMGSNIIEKYENLTQLKKKVLAIPQIKSWVENCPKADFLNFCKMSNYKLTYFNLSGLGEPIRFILHQSGIKFEDKRLTFEEWPELKSQMPLGQVPVLEIDGKPYHQSKAICRFLARKNNLSGSNEQESYEIDATVDTIDDLRVAFSQYYWEKDPAAKGRLKEALETKRPTILQKLEAQVKKNGGYFVGGKLSWADLLYSATSEMLSAINESDVNKDYPELKKLVDKVRSLPKIKAYLDQRPKGLF
ncbi:uncharacterized protein LOC117601415 [Osmia lignaria lignaria]|uniref:uncharacterized protein LOC117601415 n=1 Tax=Osmia lignaria lignaria TaxID=1437193 RepID=UPI00402B6BBC